MTDNSDTVADVEDGLLDILRSVKMNHRRGLTQIRGESVELDVCREVHADNSLILP